jgi:hypothetical protein
LKVYAKNFGGDIQPNKYSVQIKKEIIEIDPVPMHHNSFWGKY